MSKFRYLIESGHGGLDPKTNEYVTRGKRSPKWEDKTFPDGSPFILYEGVNNRDNTKRIIKALQDEGIDCLDLVPGWEDESLGRRIRKVNRIHKEEKKSILISIHSNAAGSSGEWANARGNGLYIYSGASKTSRLFANILGDQMEDRFSHLTRWRGIKERDFYVLRESSCPAILIEAGFHDNKEDAALILTCEYKDALVKSIVEAIKIFEEEIIE